MRTFIAIDLPQNLKTELAQIQENLKSCGLEFKWVRPENIHLTLKFLGNADEKLLPRIKKTIEEICFNQKAFKLSFENFGFFPNARRPQVFFISTNNQNLLKTIADKLEAGLGKIGFPIEGRFKSHLTLARIKNRKNLEALLDKIKEIKFEGDFVVNELIVYESRLSSCGPVYEKIASSRFAE